MSEELYKLDNIEKDISDVRDYVYKTEVDNIPKSFSLMEHVREIEDQSRIGSCTGNATCSAIELEFDRNHGKHVNLSRLFAYYTIRLIGGKQRLDNGAPMRDCFKAMNKYGIISEEMYPYDIAKVTEEPPKHLFIIAERLKVKEYRRVYIPEIRGAIASGHPVIFGMKLSREFFNIGSTFEETMKYAPISRIPGKNNYAGSHAMVMVGYDEDGVFIENSWGSKWGVNGVAKISWATLEADIGDAWVATKYEFKDGKLWDIFYAIKVFLKKIF